MKTLFILLFISISGGAFAQQFVREFIQEKLYEADYRLAFGSACYDKLVLFYSSGNLLKSKIFEEESTSLAQFGSKNFDLEFIRGKAKLPKGYYTFYHYTKVEKLADVFDHTLPNRDQVQLSLKDGPYKEVMSFIKNPARRMLFSPEHFRVNDGFLYVSSCPSCSSSFGHIQLSFTFRPEAKIINIDAYNYPWERVSKEMKETYPEVMESCDFDQMGILALEDSGIDLIHYTGSWFQMTNFYNVVNNDAIIAKGDVNRITYDRLASRKYSVSPSSSENLASARTHEARITVLEASWFNKNDSLKNAKNLCDGKEYCDYKIHEKFIPTVKYQNQQNSFSIKWKCRDDGDILEHTVASNARGETFTLDCR